MTTWAGRPQCSMMRSTAASSVVTAAKTAASSGGSSGRAEAGSAGLGVRAKGRSPRSSRMWLASATRVAPSRMSWLQPAELGLSMGPGTAKMGLPYSEARFAVMSEPDHAGHSTTRRARDHAATMRLRMGNVCLSGAVWSGNSETTAPWPSAIFSARWRFSGG